MLRLILSISFLISAPLMAADDVNENPLTATARLAPSELQPGANGTVKISVELAPHHKAYLDMFKLKLVSPENAKVGAFKISPTFKFKDKFSKKEREAVKDNSEMVASFELPEGIAAGEQKAVFEISYQACSEEYCLFPKTLNVEAPFTVASLAAKPKDPPPSAGAPAPSGSMSAFDQALAKGMFFTFLFVFLAGVATSLTPCIFPMIPITLAVIGAKTGGQTKVRSFTLSLAYVFGIAITYACLGVLAAYTGALFGAALGNPWVVSAIAVMFVAMGLSMYGVFEFKVPAFIGDRLNNTKTERGFKGAFITGLIAGIVASPCVGPVLVSILTYVAQTQNLVLGFFLLFTFAMGVGQLFLVLGTFSSLTQSLPRSGGWMDAVKFLFGTTMIAMALYYLEPVANDRLFAGLVALALILISSAYGAFDTNTQLESVAARMRKAVMLTMFV
ncbi:MAG: cytochrome c biogenesis protein CcdA, partial [Bdellovibrionia bacterium]